MIDSPNVELVRSIYAGLQRGDFTSVEWAHPEIEYVIADGPEPGSWRGPAGLAEGTRGLLEAWEGFYAEPEEYRELDGERVLVLARLGGRGKHSDLELGQMASRGAALFQVRDGMVTKEVVYWDGDRRTRRPRTRARG